MGRVDLRIGGALVGTAVPDETGAGEASVDFGPYAGAEVTLVGHPVRDSGVEGQPFELALLAPRDRAGLVYGTYRPSQTPDSVGIPLGTTLTAHAGDLTHYDTGTRTVENLDISGQVKNNSTAGKLILRRCRVRVGALPAFGTLKAGVQSSYTNPNGIELWDCEVVPDNRSVDIYGVHGRHVKAYRTLVRGCVDAFVLFGEGAGAYGCLALDSPYYANDPRQVDGSHNDAYQLEGLGALALVGVECDASFHNAGVMVTQNVGAYTTLVIRDSWLDGGDWTVNVSEKGKGAIRLTLTGNRVGRNGSEAKAGRAPIIMPPTTAAVSTVSGQVWQDGGTGQLVRTDGA